MRKPSEGELFAAMLIMLLAFLVFGLHGCTVQRGFTQYHITW